MQVPVEVLQHVAKGLVLVQHEKMNAWTAAMLEWEEAMAALLAGAGGAAP